VILRLAIDRTRTSACDGHNATAYTALAKASQGKNWYEVDISVLLTRVCWSAFFWLLVCMFYVNLFLTIAVVVHMLHLPAPAHYPWNIFPQSLPKWALFLKFRFFFDFRGAPLPTCLRMSATFLWRSIALRHDYRTCKFQLSMSYPSGDIGRQSWSQEIWSKNEAEKN